MCSNDIIFFRIFGRIGASAPSLILIVLTGTSSGLTHLLLFHC